MASVGTQIELDLVTPSRRIVVGAHVASVKMPAADGEIEILPGHTELITLLGTGSLEFTQDGSTRRFAVSYGFAEVRNNRVLVLAETCEEAKDIDKNRAKEALKRAEHALAGALTEAEFDKQERKRNRAVVRQELSALVRSDLAG